MKITEIQAMEILDSRGIPTISTTIKLDDGTIAKGEVPSGASTGKTEVLELRDNDPKRYFGKGVLKAVNIVNTEIAKAVIGKEFSDQYEFDKFLKDLDGTEYKTRLGGNSILSVSMAFCRATAQSMQIPLYQYFAQLYWKENWSDKLDLPMPLILIMEGGKHGNWATDIQEYKLVPLKNAFPNYAESLRAGAEIFKTLHDILVGKGYSATVGFEGAFAPNQIQSNKEAFDLIMQAIEKAGYKPYEQIKLAIDLAASEFYDEKSKLYNLRRENKQLTADEFIDFQLELYSHYPMYSIEDPLYEEAWSDWQKFMKKVGDKYQVIGDDLLTTNIKRIQKAIDLKAVNAVLIKLNQIGTVAETLDAIKLSESAGYKSVVSHRGGETNDDMIADLVVGTYADQSKFGGPDRGERLAKYNRLLKIEKELKG